VTGRWPWWTGSKRCTALSLSARGLEVAELVEDQAEQFLDELEDEFGFLDNARDGAGNALDAMEDWGGRAKDTVENLF
jgi:hypothetical protein